MTAILSGRRILLVEDEMLVLMHLEARLEDLGCSSIRSASNVAQALFILEQDTFDMAIIDINLGGAKSCLIADALEQRDTPYVFTTGYSGRGAQGRREIRPMLFKPYTDADLLKALCQLLPNLAQPLP